ncbi:hypothetical protein AB0H49_34015 [Nocardia sp. NPDC050713]|uniref:hypothetical protein n=1 Tax=Nocardia sp. NPDC050713 TaxID=3154511 RepID=UPI0033D5E4FD
MSMHEQELTRPPRGPRPRKRRITLRDQLFLEWLTQQYGAPIDVVAQWYGVKKSWAYEIVAALAKADKVELTHATVGERDGIAGPMWVVPTRATAYGFLGTDPGQWTVRPSTAAHVRALGELRLALTGRDTDPQRWVSERLLRSAAAPQGAAAMVGAPHPYCHDALFTDDSGKLWAVECELTVKRGAGRMKSTLLTSIRAAQQLQRSIEHAALGVSGVIYFCRGAGVNRHVQAAVDELRAEDVETGKRLHVRDLDTIIAGRKKARS